MKNQIEKQSKKLMFICGAIALLLVVCYVGIKPTYSVCEYEDGNYFCYDENGGSASNNPGEGSGWTPDVVGGSDGDSSSEETGGNSSVDCSWNIDSQSYVGSDCVLDSKGNSSIPTGSSNSKPSAGSTVNCSYDIDSQSYVGSDCVPDNNGNSSVPSSKVTYEDGSFSMESGNIRYNYDSDGNLLSIVTTDDYGNIINVVASEKSGLSNLTTTINSSESEDGSYQTTQTNTDGSKIVKNYDKNGNLLSTITYGSDGSMTIKSEEGSGLKSTNNVIYYDDITSCQSLSGGACTKIGTTYVNTEQVKQIAYYSQDYCQKITGVECKSILGQDGNTYYIANDCNCDSGCKVQPSSAGSTGGSGGTGSSGGSSTDIDSEVAAPGTVIYPANSSNNNVESNPKTGSVAIFMVWIIALGTLVYSFVYFKQSKFE